MLAIVSSILPLVLLGCSPGATNGVAALPIVAPAAAATPPAPAGATATATSAIPSTTPSPAERLGDCTAVPFIGTKVDYQCGAVKVAYLEFRGYDDPAAGAAALAGQFGPEARPARSVVVDGVSVDVRAFTMRSGATSTPMWAAFAVADGRVREVLCMPVAESTAVEADCARVVSLLAVHGAVEPRAAATPPFAGRAMTAPPGCRGYAEPGWHGVVSCPDGSELRWRSSPFVKDLDAHFGSYGNFPFVGTRAAASPVACTVDGAEGTCLVRTGPASVGASTRNALTAYAVVRDDGVTASCFWSGGPALPAACASVLTVAR